MSGVMIKVAIYALVRARGLGRPAARVDRSRRSGSGRSRRWRCRVRALPARPQAVARAALDREHRDHRAGARRLPAAAQPRRRGSGLPSRSAARRCCTRSTTPCSRRCCSLARARSRKRLAHRLDQLGGLLRRMPWTGGAFLVGAMAIAGLLPLNGFASEWLTLQALLHVRLRRRRRRRRRRDRARRARLDRRPGRALLRQGGRPHRLGRPRRHQVEVAQEAPASMRAASFVLAVACVVLGGGHRGCCSGRWSASPPGPTTHRCTSRCPCPALTADRRNRALVLVALTGALVSGPLRRRARPELGGQLGRAETESDRAPGFTGSRSGSCSRRCCAPSARSPPCRTSGGVVQEVAYTGHVPHLIDEFYRPATRLALAGAARERGGSRSAPRRLRLLPARSVVVLGAARLGVPR